MSARTTIIGRRPRGLGRLAPALVVVAGLLALLPLLTAGRGAAAPGATERVSVDGNGTQGDGQSLFPAISADGRYVAFESRATNLVAGDTNNLCDTDFDGAADDNCHDVFVRDRQAGTVELVSVDSNGNQANGVSYRPYISTDGRYVAFFSYASNLVPGDTNGEADVFVHDRQTGTTERVSVDSNGTQGNNGSFDPAVSADGRYVAFWSRATNLVDGDTNGYWDVFVHDRQTGTTERVSVDSNGAQGDGFSEAPAISADGRYVAFKSSAQNLVPDDAGNSDVFVRDRQAGTTELVSVDSSGNQANGGSSRPSVSSDGRYVAFYSYATNLVPGDTNNFCHLDLDGVPDNCYDVFVHDRQTGATERVSVDSNGNEGNGSSYEPDISADGRYVAFFSEASNLVSGDSNSFCDLDLDGSDENCLDVFVHDRQTGTTERVSVDSSGNQANGLSDHPAVSGDGRYVAFESWASNLVPGDTNNFCHLDLDGVPDNCPDAFVHDRGAPPTPTPTSSAGPQLKQGDVDCDGDGDAVDALKVLRRVASLSVSQNPSCPEVESPVAGHPFGDVDCDNDVDAVDALKVMRYVALLPVQQNGDCTDIGEAL